MTSNVKSAVKAGESSQTDLKVKELVDGIIKRMEEGATYQKGWLPLAVDVPYNPVTGTRYSGINFLSLILQDCTDPRWFTFAGMQAFAKKHELKLKLKKGSKGVPIYRYVTIQPKDENGEPKLNSEGNPVVFKILKYQASVFNAEWIEGMPAFENKVAPIVEGEQNEFVEELIAKISEASGISIKESGNSAYYAIATDSITIPSRDFFKTHLHRYRTVFHEFGHATGSKSRLNRESLDRYSEAKEYRAKEELVAELTSYFIGSMTGIGYDSSQHEQHAGYLSSWIAVLKKDYKQLFAAAGHASKAASMICEWGGIQGWDSVGQDNAEEKEADAEDAKFFG